MLVGTPKMLEITPDTLDWASINNRIHGYRLVKGLTLEQLSSRCNLPLSWMKKLSKGGKSKSLEELWTIIRTENLSINWFFNGVGEYFSDDPENILPPTIIRHRKQGVRRSKERINAEDGYIVGDPLDFILAVDLYKRHNSSPYPSLSEIFEILLCLGYRKIASPTIKSNRKSLNA